MRPVTAWAIGLYRNGRCTTLGRWRHMGGKPRDPIIGYTRREVVETIQQCPVEVPAGALIRPVRVRIELVK